MAHHGAPAEVLYIGNDKLNEIELSVQHPFSSNRGQSVRSPFKAIGDFKFRIHVNTAGSFRCPKLNAFVYVEAIVPGRVWQLPGVHVIITVRSFHGSDRDSSWSFTQDFNNRTSCWGYTDMLDYISCTTESGRLWPDGSIRIQASCFIPREQEVIERPLSSSSSKALKEFTPEMLAEHREQLRASEAFLSWHHRPPFSAFSSEDFGAGRSRQIRLGKVCAGHAWLQLAEISGSMGDLFEEDPPRLKLGDKVALLNKALEPLTQAYKEEMAGAKKAVKAQSAEAHRAQAALESLQAAGSRPVEVQVFGLAGLVCEVPSDAGSTIFHVKTQIAQRLLPNATWYLSSKRASVIFPHVKRQTLFYGTHKLEDEDVLGWFQSTDKEEGPAVAKLTLVLANEDEVPTGWTWRHMAPKPESWEMEHATWAAAAAAWRLPEVQKKEPLIKERFRQEMKEVAKCAEANGLLDWFKPLVKAWDLQAGTNFSQGCADVISQSPSRSTGQRRCKNRCKGPAPCDPSCVYHPEHEEALLANLMGGR